MALPQVPITTEGKILAGATMLIGIVVISLPISVISSNFSVLWKRNRGEDLHDDDEDSEESRKSGFKESNKEQVAGHFSAQKVHPVQGHTSQKAVPFVSGGRGLSSSSVTENAVEMTNIDSPGKDKDKRKLVRWDTASNMSRAKTETRQPTIARTKVVPVLAMSSQDVPRRSGSPPSGNS